jgi:hypothetical protein
MIAIRRDETMKTVIASGCGMDKAGYHRLGVERMNGSYALFRNWHTG